MVLDKERVRRNLMQFRRRLPLTAYPRPALLATLRTKGIVSRGSPRLSIVDVFDGGEAFGLLCRFSIEAHERDFVAPLDQVSFKPALPPAPSKRRFDGARLGSV
jgi:hypothetical protein